MALGKTDYMQESARFIFSPIRIEELRGLAHREPEPEPEPAEVAPPVPTPVRLVRGRERDKHIAKLRERRRAG